MFSKKTTVHTSASVSRLVDNKDIKDLHYTAVLDYTLTNNDRVDALSTSFNDVYNRQVASSLGNNAIRISNYAANKYYYGVAEGYRIKKDNIDFVSIAKEYINKITNDIPIVEYAKLGPVNYSHATFFMLQEKYNYSFETNTLVIGSVTYYLDNFIISYASSSLDNAEYLPYFDPLGIPASFGVLPNRVQDTKRSHTEWVEDKTAVNDYVTIKLLNTNLVPSEISLNFLDYEWSGKVPELGEAIAENQEPDYFMIGYISENVRKIILARYEFGYIPELDKAVSADVDPGRYLPNFYVYRNGRAENDYYLKDGEAYKSSVKLCREMNLNYDELVNAIYDGVKSEEALQTAYITFRLAVNDFKDNIVQEYMYNYFYEMYKDSDAPTRSEYSTLLDAEISEQARAGISIYLGDKVSRSSIGYNSIGVQIVRGNIGKVGTCTGEIRNTPYGSGGSGLLTRSRGFGSAHVFKKQLTENTYREVIVRGLFSSYGVDGGDDVVGTKGDSTLLIPLDVDIVVKRMGRHKHALVSKALHAVVTAKVVTKEKWYETGLFKIVMFIIAIVLTIVFPPAGAAAWSAMAVAYAVAIAVVVSVAVTLVSKLLYAMGLKSGIVMAIIAVIAIIIGGYAAAGNTTVAGLSATQILSISNIAFSISNNLTAMQMEARYKAYLDYTAKMDQELEELEQKKKDLGLELYTDHDMFTLLAPSVYKPDVRLGESPLSFLNRVTGVTSAVDIYLQMIPNYVFISTQLPTIEDSLRGRSSYGSV